MASSRQGAEDVSYTYLSTVKCLVLRLRVRVMLFLRSYASASHVFKTAGLMPSSRGARVSQ